MSRDQEHKCTVCEEPACREESYIQLDMMIVRTAPLGHCTRCQRPFCVKHLGPSESCSVYKYNIQGWSSNCIQCRRRYNAYTETRAQWWRTHVPCGLGHLVACLVSCCDTVKEV
jgi:hypothetical protein